MTVDVRKLKMLHFLHKCTTMIDFFCCDGDHRDLHSFPTRRSSDLARGTRKKIRIPALLKYDSSQVSSSACELSYFKRDRKSTRLNSSHSQISYAVFCLKKKKIHTKHADTIPKVPPPPRVIPTRDTR